jgi:CO/xanthine dehydrogenase Mo-binding subunit
MADVTGINGQRKDFRVVGKTDLPGKLSWAVASGLARFGVDYVVPDMLEAKFLRSPHAHVRIKGYNLEKARAVPGVVDIVTWKDEDLKNSPAAASAVRPSPSFPMSPRKRTWRWDSSSLRKTGISVTKR